MAVSSQQLQQLHDAVKLLLGRQDLAAHQVVDGTEVHAGRFEALRPHSLGQVWLVAVEADLELDVPVLLSYPLDVADVRCDLDPTP